MMSITKNIPMKCVMARVMRHVQKYQKNFTLKDYGSWEQAGKAAKRWLKGKKKNLPPQLSSYNRMTSRNSSGVVGVKLDQNIIRRKSGAVYEYWRWVASWPNCPNSGGLAWSINKFGDEDAFVLAILSRSKETINRNFLINELRKIKASEEYHEILSIKEQSPPYEITGTTPIQVKRRRRKGATSNLD
jgi:hypothetical protein